MDYPRTALVLLQTRTVDRYYHKATLSSRELRTVRTVSVPKSNVLGETSRQIDYTTEDIIVLPVSDPKPPCVCAAGMWYVVCGMYSTYSTYE
jgi:hypothetical protein